MYKLHPTTGRKVPATTEGIVIHIFDMKNSIQSVHK